jgi:hypothetical protein
MTPMSLLPQTPPPLPARATVATSRRERRDPFLSFTCVCVVLAVVGNAYETVSQHLAAAAAAAAAAAKPSGPQPGRLDESAYTNVDAAQITLTNLNAFPVETCVRAVITGKRAGTVMSVPVCTGEMKPRTTVVLSAPYPVGAVMKLCEGEPGQFGITRVDWSRCSFTIEPVKE